MVFLGVFLLFWGQKVLTNHVTEASVSNSKAMLVGLEALMKKGADSEELQKLVREMNQSFSQMEIQLATTDFQKLDSVEVVRSD
jgi:peroxiredoxin family protein